MYRAFDYLLASLASHSCTDVILISKLNHREYRVIAQSCTKKNLCSPWKKPCILCDSKKKYKIVKHNIINFGTFNYKL